MAVTQNTSGTQTATIDTEHTLATITSAGVYTLNVDFGNHANGDVTVLKAYIKVRSGDASTLLFQTTVADIPPEGNVVSIAIPAVHEVKFTLEQTDGTGRSFDWSVFDLGATPSQTDSGSQTATISTVHTLATKTDGETYVLFVDTSNMALSDTLELIAQFKTLTGSTEDVVERYPASNVQVLPIKMLGPWATVHSLKFTLEQSAGTGRAFPWSVVKL